MKFVTIDSVVEGSGVYYPTSMQNFIQVEYGWQWSKWYIFLIQLRDALVGWGYCEKCRRVILHACRCVV